MSIGKFLVGWFGIATVCALGAYYITPTGVGLTQKLEAKAEIVKKDQFADWATVSFAPKGKWRNRIASVTGAAPSEEAKASLRTALMANFGNLSISDFGKTGGIKDVVFVDEPGAAVAPTDYRFRADVGASDVVLSGVVPSDAVRADLVKFAEARFAAPKRTVVDKMTVKAGTMQPGWADVAKRGIGYVGDLGNQYAELAGSQLSVVGKSADAKLIARIETEMSSGLPADFQGRPTIEGPGVAPVLAPAVQAQVNTCQADMNAAMAGKTIEFDSGKSSLRERPNALLDSIAQIAAKCPDVQVEIAGHTDSRGNDAANMALSDARASSVAKYLVAKGAAAARLTAKGYGETQPLDPADTPEALQKNRRIEFKVSAEAAAK